MDPSNLLLKSNAAALLLGALLLVTADQAKGQDTGCESLKRWLIDYSGKARKQIYEQYCPGDGCKDALGTTLRDYDRYRRESIGKMKYPARMAAETCNQVVADFCTVLATDYRVTSCSPP